MPRRPRPVSRGGQPRIKKAPATNPQPSSSSSKPQSNAKTAPPTPRNLKRPAAESVDDDPDEDQFFGNSSDEDEEETEYEEDISHSSWPRRGQHYVSDEQEYTDSEDEEDEEVENDDDADAPRVALWEPDDDEAYLKDDEEDKEAEAEEVAAERKVSQKSKGKEIAVEKSLQDSLQDLPLGALRQAQKMLAQAAPESDSDSDSENGSGDDGPPEAEDLKGKRKEKVEKVEWSNKRRTDIAKRSSKHAPTEVTSKRPVSRKRQVVEVPKIVARDPRFMTTAGEFDANRFTKSYSFLTDNHKTELTTLKDNLARARKLLANSPRDLRPDREAEVSRLEQAVKRAESTVNRDRQQAVEREALGRVKKAERDSRAQGKGEWHLKRGERQKLVVQARYEALAKEGGQRAVKKAIEKKQKKVSQKEKRSRPYAKGEFSSGGMGAGGGGGGDRPFKRRRV